MSHLDRAVIKAALGSWFALVTGLEPRDRETSQHWGGTWNPARSSAPVAAHGELWLKEIGSVGIDRVFYEVRSGDGVEAGEEILPHVQGARELLWEVRVKSWSQDDGKDAHFYLARVRDLIHGPTAQAVLTGLGLGVQSVRPALDMTITEKGRRVSLAQLDIRFNAAVDVEDQPFGYVDTFAVESEWRSESGALLPDAQQFEGEIP